MSIRDDVQSLVTELEAMLDNPDNNRLDAGCLLLDITKSLKEIIMVDDSKKIIGVKI